METRLKNGTVNGNGYHGPRPNRYEPDPSPSLNWLDLRVIYIRISKCDITNDTTPEYLTLNHEPLNHDTSLKVHRVSTLLRRDRLDKKSEEVMFVSTDNLRTTGSVKFKIFDKNVLVVSGLLDLCHGNNGVEQRESNDHNSNWRMECETDSVVGNGFLKGKENMGLESDPPLIEVCLAGSFAGNPIILTKSLQLGCIKKLTKKGDESMVNEEDGSCGLGSMVADNPNYNLDHEYHSLYSGMEYENEDGELSWFNAGVRVGVGIGLSVCLGLGIGVGLLVRTYQGTTRNFTRRLL